MSNLTAFASNGATISEQNSYKIKSMNILKTAKHDLISIAKQTNEKTIMAITNNGITKNIEVPVARQLLVEKEFSDGSIEKTYVATALADQSKSNTENHQWNIPSGYYITTTLHYTLRYTNTYVARVDKVVTMVNRGSSSVSVSSATQGYKCSPSVYNSQSISYTNAGMQVYTLSSAHSGFYQTHPDLITSILSGVSAYSTFNFSNGQGSSVQMAAYS